MIQKDFDLTAEPSKYRLYSMEKTLILSMSYWAIWWWHLWFSSNDLVISNKAEYTLFLYSHSCSLESFFWRWWAPLPPSCPVRDVSTGKEWLFSSPGAPHARLKLSPWNQMWRGLNHFSPSHFLCSVAHRLHWGSLRGGKSMSLPPLGEVLCCLLYLIIKYN